MNLDECSKQFRSLRGAQNVSEACYLLEQLFAHYEVLNIELGRDSVFWRARPTNKAIDDPEHLGPPPKEITPINRLNDASAPCLYAAMREETALLEVGAQPGQLVQLAGYRCKGESPFRVALIGEFRHVQQMGYLRLTGTDPNHTIARFLDQQGLESGRRTIFIDAFLASLLSDPSAADSDYVLSRAVAAMVYSRNKDVEGVFLSQHQGPPWHKLGPQSEFSSREVSPYQFALSSGRRRARVRLR